MLTLFCLGDLRLERDGAMVLSGRRKPLALLAFLARRGQRRCTREELADLLWGAGDDASARKSLRQCLSELRSIDGIGFDESDSGVTMATGTIVTDAELFEGEIRAGRWGSALERWQGDFVSGGESLGEDAWQAWLDGERVALRRQLAMACEQITASAEQRGEWREVVDAAHRWRSVLPDDSRAWAREIHALQSSGRLTEAITRVAEAEQYFRNELRVGVPDDVARLARVLARLGQVAGTPAASLLTPDLVGRGETLAAMARARLQVRNTEAEVSALLIVAGEGRGKTRVLREFMRQTRDGDPSLTLIEATALPTDKTRPFSLLHTVLTRIASHDALAGCSPETLATLAHIAPALREHFRHVPTMDPARPLDVPSAFARALAEVALASPVVLVLDDFPEGDPESLGALTPLLHKAPSRTLILAAGRPESWQQSASVSEVLNHADPANRLALEPLRREETRVLLSSMAPLSPATLETLTASLHELSGGIPGLLTSLMTHHVTSGLLTRGETGEFSLGPAPSDAAVISPDLEERWRSRYYQAPPDARRVLDAVAVLGSGGASTSAEVVEEIAQLDANGFRTAFDSLRTAGVLHRIDDVVRFVAEAHRVLTYRALPPSTRLQLHARAAKLLRASADRRRSIGAVAVAGVALVVVVGWYGFRNAATVKAGAPVLLADIENLTGDTALARPLFLAASIGLQQSRQISVFPRSRVQETLALMQRPEADTILNETLAREVAMRENLQRVVLLGVARVESAYMVTARIIHPASGRDLFADQERAATRGDVVEKLDLLLTRVRRASGEPVDSVRAYSVPLPRVTTGSLAALQAYAAGADAWTRRRYGEARARYRSAIELDSAFALAWLGLAQASYQLYRDRAGGDAELAQAMRYADRLTERERLRLEQVSLASRGLVEDELVIASQLARRFPERDTWYNLGTSLMRMRRCPEAIAALKQSQTFDPTFANAHINVATCYLYLGASDSAVAAYTRAYAVDSGSVYTGGLNHEFGAALVRAGLVDSARRVYTKMARGIRALDRQYGQRSLAYLAAWIGRAREADAHFDSAAALAAEIHQPLSEFRNRILQAEHRLTIQPTRAGPVFDEAAQLATHLTLDPAFAMYAGLAHVRGGQLQRAAKLLEGMAPESRLVSAADRTTHAVLSARIALARGDGHAARRALETATDTTRSDYILPALVDVHMALGHADSALAASAQFADRATFGTDAQDAWLRNLLRKAQLSERLGRLDEARTGYARVERQLSSGDADHPLRMEAERGIARLAERDARREMPVRPPPR